MALTVRENIMANIATVLATITVANGYANTVGSVQRWKQNGNPLTTVPAIIIHEGAESNEDKPDPLTNCHLSVYLALYIRESEDAAAGTGTTLNSLLGDIVKALKVDITRGGYAADTTKKGDAPFEVVEGEAYAGLVIELDIHYRYKQTDPQIAG